MVYNNPTESDHDLKLSKDGYNEKEIRIRTPLGYKLSVAAYLSTNTASLPSSTQAAANSNSPSGANPRPTPVNRVTILNTPTGFLRVRKTPSIDASEVGQVTPGKAYELVDEQNDWFEIKLADGTTGWISSQYATKQ